MSLQDFKTGESGKNRILVFTADVVPTDAEIELAKEHKTKAFRNSQCDSLPVEEHRYAVSIAPVAIPEGYKEAPVDEPVPPPVGKKNPTTNAKGSVAQKPMTPSDVE